MRALNRQFPIEASAKHPNIVAPINGRANHSGLLVVGIMSFLISNIIITHAIVSAVVFQPLALRISSHLGSAGLNDIYSFHMFFCRITFELSGRSEAEVTLERIVINLLYIA